MWRLSSCAQLPRYTGGFATGCVTDDVNKLIRDCFTLSQQQKVTESKYIKDEGHAVIDQADADNIINAATTQRI
jgi:hypothetical protein